MRVAHLIMIPFTGVGLHKGFRGRQWFDYRIELFKKYTLKSILNQSSNRFIIWCSFRPEEESNPSIAELSKYLINLQVQFIFTFDGVMYWDDKFSHNLKDILKNLGRIGRDCVRLKKLSPLSDIKELCYNKNDTLRERASRSVQKIGKALGTDWNYVYVTRLDSDDMLHRDAIKKIQELEPQDGAIILKKGYVYNGYELAEWNPTTCPPFYTIVFPASVFFFDHIDYYKNWKSHEDTEKVWRTRVINERLYCVNVHGNQISTVWQHPFKGEEVNIKLLNEFLPAKVPSKTEGNSNTGNKADNS